MQSEAMHILVIDDDPDFLDALSAELKRAGYRVTGAAGCNAGLDVIATASARPAFDAVLVDIFMPEADGIETIRALRTAGVTAPVIAISGGGAARFDGVLAWATALGADASLAKPFEMKRLADVLKAVSAGVVPMSDDADKRTSLGAR